MKLKNFLFFILFISLSAFGRETFIVQFSPDQVVVTSANEKRDEYNVIIKNRMMTPLKGRIESLELDILIPISVPTKKDRTYKIKWKKGRIYRILPLSPPFEEIRLEVGKEKYEIPPKK